MRRLLLVPIALLGGCTVNLQRPAAQSDWIAQHADAARCPLELVDARRRAPIDVDATGVPTPLVAWAIGQAGSDRELRVGDSLALVAGAAAESQRPPPSATNARIDAAWDAQGRQIPLRQALTSGATVELSRGAGSEAPSTRKIVIYKGDMPDASRPNTCDNRLRDGDYVFVRSAPNATWLDGGAALWLAPAGAGTVHSVGSTPPAADLLCFAGPRVCYADHAGDALCTWQPHCLDPPAS